MNRYAYLATGQLIAFMETLSKVRVRLHGRENIPEGSLIFVVNHFTRIETLLLPYHVYQLTGVPVWSLADSALFNGALGGLLETVGAVSTRAPDRDRLIVKSLLTGEANWIIFPEGRMVKDKAIVERTRFTASYAVNRRPPHTGAATLALRTEFYRRRLRKLAVEQSAETERLQALFGIDDMCPVLSGTTRIVPINITYYPLRARENMLSRLADRVFGKIPANLHEELQMEGAMLMEGVDIDIRIGRPIEIERHLGFETIEHDIFSPKRIDFDDRLPSRKAMRREAFSLMQRYMAGIYELTTVNHDHLFASLLRSMPFRRISPEDLRRKAFLLAQRLAPLGINLHHSLDFGQAALLTDDRFNKYREFLAIALESGVVRQEGDVLVKEPKKFSSPLDFNRARIDNPIGVVSNEVIPLAELQKQALLIAWLPERVVRYLTARHLLRQAEREFEADYRLFFRNGESKGHEVGRPILVKGNSRELGVVLVHGFLAAPREMQELAEYLGRLGLWVYVVRLKGHGTSPDDLVRRCGEDWRESVDAGYAAIRNICKRVVVGGFSFGGGLALDCAARLGDTAGVFAVCPPMRLQDLSSRFAPSVTVWNRLMDHINFRDGKKECVQTVSEHPDINYTRLPVAGVAELGRFMKALEPRLPEVKVPALVVQSKGDPVVDPAASKRLFERIGSERKEYRLFDFERHGILSGSGADQVHEVIGRFIEQVRDSH
ncbi:MAG: alpha/beta fold hydrolase [Deltaproteobacteria bacterium]|nr:alpha/beta fold hydrolase [Deltaproteobacteria bacterium]